MPLDILTLDGIKREMIVIIINITTALIKMNLRILI